MSVEAEQPAQPDAQSELPAQPVSLVGQRWELDIERVAAGGVCVARHDGRVVFVRHTLPGERVVAVVREGGDGDRYLRADAVEVLQASPDRVPEPCPYAGPGRCGGCDWQHVRVPAQRELKARLIEEQLHRLAGLDLAVAVEAVSSGDPEAHDAGEGLGWRTRMQFAVASDGRLGLRKSRSHQLEVLGDHGPCRIAHPGIASLGVYDAQWNDVSDVEVAVAPEDGGLVIATARKSEGTVGLPPLAGGKSTGRLLRWPARGRVRRGRTAGPPEQVDGPGRLTMTAAGRSWRVSAGTFWQVHPAAAETLAEAVVAALQPRPGESALDLYAGVGLFAGVLADLLGPDGLVTAVESDRGAVADARRNLHDAPTVRLVSERVDVALSRPEHNLPVTADLVVLDPPRSGAGATVVAEVTARSPRRIAYVACDPAALARDVASFAAAGYLLTGLRAFDLFPMTQHVECVALLEPQPSAS